MAAPILTEGDALLADVIADPGDVGLRLIYADWLEEFGTPADAARAAFIRRQLLLLEKIHIAAGDRYAEGGGRSGGWDFEIHCPADVESCVVAGGFIAEVTCAVWAWRRHGPRLVRAHPLTRTAVSPYRPATPAGAAGIFGWERSTVRLSDRSDPFTDPFTLPLTSYVPADVWDLLPRAGRHRWAGGMDGRILFPGWALYPAAAAADAALSAAFLSWARKQGDR